MGNIFTQYVKVFQSLYRIAKISSSKPHDISHHFNLSKEFGFPVQNKVLIFNINLDQHFKGNTSNTTFLLITFYSRFLQTKNLKKKTKHIAIYHLLLLFVHCLQFDIKTYSRKTALCMALQDNFDGVKYKVFDLLSAKFAKF